MFSCHFYYPFGLLSLQAAKTATDIYPKSGSGFVVRYYQPKAPHSGKLILWHRPADEVANGLNECYVPTNVKQQTITAKPLTRPENS